MKLIVKLFSITSVVLLVSCGGQKQQTLQEDKKPDEKKVESVVESPDLPTNSEVKIGNQTWMTRNLDVEKFRNGDSIPQAENDEQWKSAGESKKPIWAYYDYDESNGKKYGKLYNWYAVKDKRGIAPNGWNVPSNTEWEELINFLGGYEIAGRKLKTSKGWAKNGNGTNETGFFGLPSGVFHFNGGSQYKSILNNAQWWTNTQKDDDQVYAPALSSENDKIITWMPRKDYGFSVRCIKD